MNNNLQLPPIPVSVLGLSDVEVINVEIDKYNQFVFTVVSTKRKILCHCCGKPTQPYGKGRTIRLRHLPILGRKTYIDITPQRGRCPDCDGNPTTTQQADWYERKSPQTKAYEQAVLMAMINSTLWGRVREPTNMRNLRLVKCFKALQSLSFRQNIDLLIEPRKTLIFCHFIAFGKKTIIESR